MTTTAFLGSLVGLSEGASVAVFDRESFALSTLDVAPGPLSRDNLAHALARAAEQAPREKLGSTRTQLAISPAFRPLLDTTRARSGRLGRLTLNIANACNLWCSYCYADHGNYHEPTSLMSPELAVAAVDQVLELYGSIDTIHFFGGEPLLNPAAIDAVCRRFGDRASGETPRFVATTNGTVFGERVQRLATEFQIGLTVSIDGPAVVHDKLRPGRNGAPSHGTVMETIDRARQLGVAVDFECTYATAHRACGISVVDLLDYFARELQDRNPHISWSYLPAPKTVGALRGGQGELRIFRDDVAEQSERHMPVAVAVEEFGSGARQSVRNVLAGKGAALTFATGIIRRLAAREAATAYCPAFQSQLSIAADGSAFPCFMFIGDETFNMGDVFDPAFPGPRVAQVWDRYRRAMDEAAGRDAPWYAGLLSGCIAGDYITSNSLADRAYEPVYERMIEEVLLGLAEHFTTEETPSSQEEHTPWHTNR